MKIEMSNQTKQIVAQLDEKLAPFTREIEELKTENEILREKINYLEKNRRINNIILYGIKENETTSFCLMELIKKKFKGDLNISVDSRDINSVYRLGKKVKDSKGRPILISFVNNWKKNEIMKNKKKLINAFISEDYPKEVLDRRRELQSQLKEEREKGNYVYINYDKLVIKEGKTGNEKRKRDLSSSPSAIEQPRKQQLTAKTNRLNAFDLMRNRSNSLPTANPLPDTEA